MALEIAFSDMLSMAQTVGIVGTMVLTLYFSKRQIQSLSKSSWHLDEKFHDMVQLIMDDPSMQRVIDAHENPTRELTFSFYVLWMCAHAYAMRHRRIWVVTVDEKLFSKGNNKRNMETNRAR
jgi:hypothetical protein